MTTMVRVFDKFDKYRVVKQIVESQSWSFLGEAKNFSFMYRIHIKAIKKMLLLLCALYTYIHTNA